MLWYVGRVYVALVPCTEIQSLGMRVYMYLNSLVYLLLYACAFSCFQRLYRDPVKLLSVYYMYTSYIYNVV